MMSKKKGQSTLTAAVTGHTASKSASQQVNGAKCLFDTSDKIRSLLVSAFLAFLLFKKRLDNL